MCASHYSKLYEILVLWREEGRTHLLARADWNVDRDDFAFGNRPLAPDARVAPADSGRHGERPAPEPGRRTWATGAAFAESVSFVVGRGALRPKPPQVGETLRLALLYPFVGQLGAPFWALYEHPHAFRRGFLGSPEEAAYLATMRLVRCRLVPWSALPSPSSYEELELDAEILEVFGPDSLLTLPPSDDLVEEDLRAVTCRTKWYSDGRLGMVSSTLKGDILNWLLLATAGARVHLLMRGEKMFHASEIAFGNRPLTLR